jgi:hypothetical protein
LHRTMASLIDALEMRCLERSGPRPAKADL